MSGTNQNYSYSALSYKTLMSNLQTLNPDEWNNIPVCIVKSIKALVAVLTSMDGKIEDVIERHNSSEKKIIEKLNF